MSLGLYEIKIVSEPVIKEIIKKEFVLLPKMQWDNDDADAFRRFLESPIGIKFQGILCEHQMLQNEQTSLSDKNFEHACGMSAGFMLLKQIILGLQHLKETRIHVEEIPGSIAHLRERLRP